MSEAAKQKLAKMMPLMQEVLMGPGLREHFQTLAEKADLEAFYRLYRKCLNSPKGKEIAGRIRNSGGITFEDLETLIEKIYRSDEVVPSLSPDASAAPASRSEFRVDEAVQRIEAKFKTSVAHVYRADSRPLQAAPEDFVDRVQIHDALKRALTERVLKGPDGNRRSLYSHQAQAIEAILAGKDCMITTSTSSGKTLCYNVPVLDAILGDKDARALYLFPLNALVNDQLEALSRLADKSATGANPYVHKLSFEDATIKAAPYFSGMDDDCKREIRKEIHPQILLTNPDMLHYLLQLHGEYWSWFFSTLKYVVLDEIHTYRGAFGAHVANIVRRLRRLCMHYQKREPIFVACSATIQNPDTLFEKIVGRRAVVIDKDGSPSGRRVFALLRKQRESVEDDAVGVIKHVVAQEGASTIAFVRSIGSMHKVFNRLRDLNHGSEKVIREYQRAMKDEDKSEIIRALRDGRLPAVISTTALMLGIDIGSLSAAVIVRWPGLFASFLQQAGRVGRRGDGLVLLLLDNDPLGEYFIENPHEFFARSPETVMVNPNNEYVVQQHVMAANHELPLKPASDQRYFGPNIETYVAELVKEGKLRRERGPKDEVLVKYTKEGLPAQEIPIRSSSAGDIEVFAEGKAVAREDSFRALRTLFKGAIYQVEDNYYRITDLELGGGSKALKAHAKQVDEPEYFTSAYLRSKIHLSGEPPRERTVFGLTVRFGKVEVESECEGFWKIRPGKEGDPEYVPLGKKRTGVSRKLRTEAAWITLPPAIAALAPDVAALEKGLTAIKYATASMVPLVVDCDENDFDCTVELRHPDTEEPTLFVHDLFGGGIGIADACFDRLEEVIERAYGRLVTCPHCSTRKKSPGCHRCLGDVGLADRENVDRVKAIELLEQILKERAESVRLSPRRIREILRRLGFQEVVDRAEGASALVFTATQEGRPVAIKVVRPALLRGDPAAKQKFLDEARTWKTVKHPNIVELLDFQEREGMLYLVLQAASGGDLRSRIGELAQKEATNLFEKILRGAANVHERGLIHRDLKPENIVFDQNDEPLLADFGLAVLSWRQVTAIEGTPAYLAPEQLAEGRKELTLAVDVYALGLLLHEMLTGARPAMARSGEPIVVSDRVPANLVAFLKKALQCSAVDRFQNAGEMLRAFHEAQER